MCRIVFRLIVLILVLNAVSSLIFAQGTATIFGKAVDAAGAALPGVRVTATNVATNTLREAVTDAEGAYTFTNLPVGTYQVAAELRDFKRYVEEGIRVQVDENRQVIVALEVGEVSDIVTVTSEAIQVDTLTGTLKEVVDAERIVNLPLNGRNALQLQRLIPGAAGVVGRGQGQNESISINGSRPNSNNYRLDGGDNHDPYFNTPSVFPNPDALQEFSIQTSSYSAAFGRNAGAVINAVTRSGTNDFHGSLFEFLRNEKLNARSFNAVSTPPFKRNQFGGTLGGPIKENKTFFFFAYQGWRERSAPGTLTAIVPTAEQRGGNLSSIRTPIIDPTTRLAFPGNIIPANRLHPASQQFLQAFVPLPNGANGLLSSNSGQQFDQDQLVTKIDHQISGSNTLSGRLLYNKDRQLEATGNLPNFFAATDYKNYNLTINDTQVFSPTLLNVVRFTYNKIDRVQAPVVPGNQTWSDFGANFTRAFPGEAPAAISTMVAGYFNAFSRYPLSHFRTNYQFSNDLNLTRGNHQFSFGGTYSRAHLDRSELFRGDPHLVFRNNVNVNFTGNALADLLLGRPSQIEQTAENVSNITTPEFALYAQDDWKATNRLALNLGLRWEPYFPFTDEGNRFAHFLPGQQSVVYPTAPRGLLFPGDQNVVGRSTIKTRWTNFAPRVGFAFDPFGTGKTSVRGGYGIFYAQIRQQADNQLASNQPFSLRLTINNPPLGLNNPYSVTGNPFPFTTPEGDAAQNYRFAGPITVITFDPDFRNGVSQQWNLNIQREFLGSYLATAAYVGSKGNHLFMEHQLNPALPGTNPNLDARRIYGPTFGPITNYASAANSTYNSMQLSLNKRLTQNFTVLTSYTWSKFIDNASADGEQASNPFNFSADKAVSDLDVPHRFVASFVVNLPGFNNANGFVRNILGGWQMNGIVVAQSGNPFSVVSGRDNSQTGINADRADLIGEARIGGNRTRQELMDGYFNTAAFAQNQIGTFGTSGRNILRGPSFSSVDFGLFKDFRGLAESHKVQFRTEVFNLFNQVNLANPDANLSSTNFGRITGTRSDPRVIQFALKYVF